MPRILLWAVGGAALLAGIVIALALAPRMAVLAIVAIGILALIVRLAFWRHLRGSRDGARDVADEDSERGAQMQTFQRDKARHSGFGPMGS